MASNVDVLRIKVRFILLYIHRVLSSVKDPHKIFFSMSEPATLCMTFPTRDIDE